MALDENVLKIWNDARGKGEKELKAAAKELIKLGQDSFKTFISDVGKTLTSEQAKQLADLYARAEARALVGDSSSATRVLGRLNLTARAAANVQRSQSTKKAIAVWDSALKIVSSLATTLASIGSAGLSSLAKVGMEAATGLVDDLAGKAEKAATSKPKKKSTKKKSTKKKKDDSVEDDDVVVEDE